MIFVDTSAWFASVVPWDADHFAATDWLKENKSPLLTTDYVVDETLTLLRMRGENARALSLGSRFFAGEIATIHRLTNEQLLEAWHTFRQFSDKGWSFTDCTSKVTIEKLGVSRAFSLDRHFRQFGTVEVVPPGQ